MTIFSLRRHGTGLGLSPRRRAAPGAGSGPPGDTEAPSVPQNLVATAVSSSQIDLTWDASTDNVGVAGYRIYRDNVLVHTSATNAYSDTGLNPATEYEYEVSAIDAASNESARSDPDSATTHSAGDTQAPSVPQNLVATAVSSSQIDLSWNASTDNVAVTGYKIYRDNVLIDTSPTNSYSDTGLSPGTYTYEVSAVDAASNESGRSNMASATVPLPDTQAPSVPQNLGATAVSSAQINLSWNASTDNVAVTGYKIYRDNVLIDTSPTNSFSDTGLSPATLYQYEVSAFDAASNESARSAPASATTHQAIVTAGLLAEWRFDSGAGQTLIDRTGNGHHGQLGTTAGADAADPTWTAQGLSFDGGDFVEHDNAGISGGVARTVLAVVKPGPSATFGLEWPGAGVNFQRWTLRNLGAPARIRLEVAGAGHTTAFNVPASTWMLVGVTQSGSNLNSAIIYFNGSSEAVPVSATLNSQGNFSWARQNGAAVPMEAAYGLIYNRALSPAEVEQNRQALKTILAARGIALP